VEEEDGVIIGVAMFITTVILFIMAGMADMAEDIGGRVKVMDIVVRSSDIIRASALMPIRECTLRQPVLKAWSVAEVVSEAAAAFVVAVALVAE
jgi:hypothetical protein